MSQNYNDPNAFYRQTGYQQPYYGAQTQPGAQKYPTTGQVAGAGMPTYGTPVYPTMPAGSTIPPVGAVPGYTGAFNAPSAAPQIPGMLPLEESYIENILRLNKGKLATVYTNFDANGEALARTFKGIIEAAGRDHLILSDPQTGMRYLIPMVYFAYATFDEELEYEYPGYTPGLASYPPR
ncbi:spore coat protein GerQ [Robertmurraya korlensis]|uniref:spore coat protein GerQ n=1 Tax=Robertmurraya korlensis TaxID=519977 RepID=UPI000B25582B|nr:spore coat protein GerQ [Robertmurraya korlensis]